jgi:alkaline phosphatase D
MTVRIPVSRRRFLTTAAASTAISAVSGLAKPYLSRAADRPLITHGIQSGDVSTDSAVIWARADRPARMLAEVATSDSFKTIERAVFVDALPESDFTAKALIDGLPAGQDIFYRISFQDLAFPTIVGERMTGRFRTAPRDRRSISFVWSGDTAGQGWGIDEARGGMRTYATMLRNRPDFFIHNGDTVYADGPIYPEQKMPNGEIWKNVVTEEKAKVAETLAEFRGNYKYNLLDRNVLAFNAEVPIFAQWDDHEVSNNWWPGEPLTRAEHQRKKYVEQSALLLAARAGRAFHEYMPLRFTQAEPGRVYRKISYGAAARRVHARHAQLPRAQRRRAGGGLWTGSLFPRPGASRLAQARAVELAGNLEGHRRRHADRPHRRLRHRPQLGRRSDRPG